MSAVTARDRLKRLGDRRVWVVRRSGKPAGRQMEVGLGLLGSVLVVSLIGHFVLPNPNTQNFAAPLQAPSLAHPFGTDDLGRDLLSRTLNATWLDFGLALAATTICVTVGTIVGTISGYFGGWGDRLIMRVTDFVIAFPVLVLALAIITIIGPGIPGLLVALTIAGWTIYARLARGEMLVLREKQFIQAAKTLGFSHRRVMLRHAMPNLIRPSVVYASSDIVANILLIATLSYLGLGVRPPTPEWGAIMSDGQPYLLTAWWITALPGLVVIVFGLGFFLVGDALGERLGVRREQTVV